MILKRGRFALLTERQWGEGFGTMVYLLPAVAVWLNPEKDCVCLSVSFAVWTGQLWFGNIEHLA